MNIYVDDMTLEQLNEWCARAQGWVDYPSDSAEHGRIWHCDKDTAPFGRIIPKSSYQPSVGWHQCGELIEKFKVEVFPSKDEEGMWSAFTNRPEDMDDDLEPPQCKTPQEAVCKAVLLSIHGMWVEVGR